MKKAMFVCSGGGHLIELLEIREAFDGIRKILVIYQGNSDMDPSLFDVRYVVAPPHGILNMLKLMLATVRLLLKERPDFLVSSGSEITIPFFFLGKLLGVKLIYLEGVAQVYSPSLTGRIVNPVVDLFLVQWKTLQDKYLRKARYRGGLI